jgi:phasin family protein
MAQQNWFGFDPNAMSEMFKAPDMTKMFEGANIPGFDPQLMVESQRKNVEALMAANHAAMAGYQDLYKKQVAIFEETMREAQSVMGNMGDLSSDGPQKQGELYKAAFEKALRNMTELAEAAKKANEEAFAIVSARAKESLGELQTLSRRG